MNDLSLTSERPECLAPTGLGPITPGPITPGPIAPGPIAVLTPPAAMRDLVRDLRPVVAGHGDSAWVHPVPPTQRDSLVNLGLDLLDAIGAVGLTQPRKNGEGHLLRPLVHLIHGPVRHLVVDDAALLNPDVLREVHQAALVARTQVWLLLDTGDRLAGRKGGARPAAHAADLLEWVNDACTVATPDHAVATWRHRPDATPDCHLPDVTWWHQPLDLTQPLPQPCSRHARIECLLAWTRRGLTAGHVGPTAARHRLQQYTQHPDTTVDDRWAMTAAGRDFITPGSDALGWVHPDAQDVTLADVAADGSSVVVDDVDLAVPAPMRPAVARLRTSRRIAGCLDHEPIRGVFAEATKVPNSRRRPGPRRQRGGLFTRR